MIYISDIIYYASLFTVPIGNRSSVNGLSLTQSYMTNISKLTAHVATSLLLKTSLIIKTKTIN